MSHLEEGKLDFSQVVTEENKDVFFIKRFYFDSLLSASTLYLLKNDITITK